MTASNFVLWRALCCPVKGWLFCWADSVERDNAVWKEWVLGLHGETERLSPPVSHLSPVLQLFPLRSQTCERAMVDVPALQANIPRNKSTVQIRPVSPPGESGDDKIIVVLRHWVVCYAICNQNIIHCVHCLCPQRECKFRENMGRGTGPILFFAASLAPITVLSSL